MDRLGELASRLAAGEIDPEDIEPRRELLILALRVVSDDRRFGEQVGRRMLQHAEGGDDERIAFPGD